MSVAPTAVYVNGVDTARLGFVLDAVLGGFDAAARSDQLVEFPQGVGAALASVPGRIATREVTLEGTLIAASRAALETAKHQLKALAAGGTVPIRLVGQDIQFHGRLGALSVTHFSPQLRDGQSAARVALRFLCADPFAYDRLPQLDGVGSTAVRLNLGTAPSRGRGAYGAVITIAGPATTPTLQEYDGAGTLLRTMAFTWSPTASDYLEVDLARGLVTRGQSGVRDNAMGLLTAGWEFPRLDPAEGDYASGMFPLLAVTSGAAIARYHRAWL